ncbi:hypothetical protein AVEN_147721-1, partial [Araneus ventricosus]
VLTLTQKAAYIISGEYLIWLREDVGKVQIDGVPKLPKSSFKWFQKRIIKTEINKMICS